MTVAYAKYSNTTFISLQQELTAALHQLKAVFPSDETSISYKIINRPNRNGEMVDIFSYQLNHQTLSEPLIGRNIDHLIAKLFTKKRITRVEQYIRNQAYKAKVGAA